MKTMRDFLSWYNNRDVGPFLEAIAKQFDFYKQRHIDMFKDGISVPGLTLLYLFNDLPPKTYFTLFNEKHKGLHKLLKDNIVGGPSIIFHRFHENDVTQLRRGPSILSKMAALLWLFHALNILDGPRRSGAHNYTLINILCLHTCRGVTLEQY